MIDRQQAAVDFWYRYIYTKGSFSSFEERVRRIKESLGLYFSQMEGNFVSSNTRDFIQFLEKNLGPVEITSNISMRVFPFTQIFLDGREVKF